MAGELSVRVPNDADGNAQMSDAPAYEDHEPARVSSPAARVSSPLSREDSDNELPSDPLHGLKRAPRTPAVVSRAPTAAAPAPSVPTAFIIGRDWNVVIDKNTTLTARSIVCPFYE